jgi:hypothetical protein
MHAAVVFLRNLQQTLHPSETRGILRTVNAVLEHSRSIGAQGECREVRLHRAVLPGTLDTPLLSKSGNPSPGRLSNTAGNKHTYSARIPKAVAAFVLSPAHIYRNDPSTSLP